MSLRQHFPMNLRNAVLVMAVMVLAVACKKEFDSPPVRTLPTGQVLTVAQLRELFTGVPKHFGGDSSVYAVVTADEESGNLYKNVYVQDHTGAIQLRLLNSGGLYQGDSIRIYLPGTVLSSYAGMLQLDSVDVDNNVVKQATQVHKEPQTVTMAQITPEMEARLIRLENVQFDPADTGLTYADAVNQTTVNRTLEDCSNNEVIVRNSGYANFAGLSVPNGKGSFVAVVGEFNGEMQLFIRDLNEVQLNGPRCGLATCDPAPSLSENFAVVQNNIDLDLECWVNVFTEGSRRWKGRVVGGESFAEAGTSSFDPETESWLVSSPIIYSGGMTLSFSSAIGSIWQHDGLTVWVSTETDLDDGAEVAAAPWQQVSGLTLAGSGTGTGTWVSSGNATLGGLLTEGQSFVIGFKYNGVQSTQTTSYRIDNLVVQ